MIEFNGLRSIQVYLQKYNFKNRHTTYSSGNRHLIDAAQVGDMMSHVWFLLLFLLLITLLFSFYYSYYCDVCVFVAGCYRKPVCVCACFFCEIFLEEPVVTS